MQFYLEIQFDGSVDELSNLILMYLYSNAYSAKAFKDDSTITILTDFFVIWIYVDIIDSWIADFLYNDYKVNVNREISVQLYPAGNEEMFSKIIKYLLNSINGDLFLDSEFDNVILFRNDSLHIEKSCWKSFIFN